MKAFCRWTAWATLCGSAVAGPVAATELDGVRLDDSAQVAGRDLKLNGAGLSLRLVFKVYAIGLYLAEPRKSADEVLNSDGPRRLAILMLRDVSGEDFGRALAEAAAEHTSSATATALDSGVLRVGMNIAAQARGLRKGDRLTMDWVPGVGAVIELNQKPLIAPVADQRFYTALLSVWLGAKPADPALKTRLLGRAPP